MSSALWAAALALTALVLSTAPARAQESPSRTIQLAAPNEYFPSRTRTARAGPSATSRARPPRAVRPGDRGLARRLGPDRPHDGAPDGAPEDAYGCSWDLRLDRVTVLGERVHSRKHDLTDTLLGGALGAFTMNLLYSWSFTRREQGRAWADTFEFTWAVDPDRKALYAAVMGTF